MKEKKMITLKLYNETSEEGVFNSGLNIESWERVFSCRENNDLQLLLISGEDDENLLMTPTKKKEKLSIVNLGRFESSESEDGLQLIKKLLMRTSIFKNYTNIVENSTYLVKRETESRIEAYTFRVVSNIEGVEASLSAPDKYVFENGFANGIVAGLFQPLSKKTTKDAEINKRIAVDLVLADLHRQQ